MLHRLRNRILPLARYEMVLGLRSPGALVVLVICCGAGVFLGGSEGITPSEVGYRIARLSALLLGFLALPLMASAARRDSMTRASDAVDSRPHQAHELMLARWMGNLAVLISVLVITAALAFASQFALGGGVAEGAGPRASLAAFADSIIAGALPLIFLCALGYCAAELLQNVLVAAIIALYWILVLLGRDYLSRIFDFSLSQNALVYLLLTAGVVAAAMAMARLRQGLENARKPNVPLISAACLLAGLALAWHFSLVRHDPPMHPHPLALAVASQSIRAGRLPGFWLPDQDGNRIGLHDYEGKPLVVGFWTPADADSTKNLATLQRIHQRYGPRGVQVIGVCLADDWSIGRRFARQRKYEFPMVTDQGTHWAEAIEASSPLAEAYEIGSFPSTFIADGERNLVGQIDTIVAGQEAAIVAVLDELLSREGS